MSNLPRYNSYGLTLKFSSVAQREEFKKSDKYYIFSLVDDTDVWDLVDIYEESVDFDKVFGFSKYKWIVFRKKEVVWSNDPNRLPDHTTCLKCRSKKIEYHGLGVGSSQVELICPKCG